MYARITTYQIRKGRIDDALALAESMKPEIMEIPGIKYWFNTANDDGSAALIAIYESRASAEAATETAREIFGRFSEYLQSDPRPTGYDVRLHAINP